MPKTRKFRSGPEILAMLRWYLVDKEELSTVCAEEEIGPSRFYRWQAQLFTEGAAVFERKSSSTRRERIAAKERIAELEDRLQRKDGVMAELLEEHVKLVNTPPPFRRWCIYFNGLLEHAVHLRRNPGLPIPGIGTMARFIG